MSVLPGRACSNWMVADAHRMDAPEVRRPERTVAVAEQMPWRFIPGKGFGHLVRNPLAGRISGHGDPDQPPSRMAKNHQTIEQLEGDGAHHEQIDRSDPRRLITKKSVAQFCSDTVQRSIR